MHWGLCQAVSLTGIARVGCPEKSLLFIFSDDVAETFTEDPSKSVRIGVSAYHHWGQQGWGWWWPTERSHSGLLSSLVATLTPSMPASVSPPLLSATVAAAGLPESTAFIPILLSRPAKQPHIQLPLRSRHLPSRFLSLQILWMTLLQMKQVMLTSVPGMIL